jgi:ribosomal protein S18 acetylase RimI-like enzyme
MDQIRSILRSPFSIDRYIGKILEKCYVADFAGDVVGVLCMDRDGYTYSLAHIEVHPELRRIGIGTSLLQTLRMAIPDDTSIEVDLDIKSHGAIAFLKENSFMVYRRELDRIYLRNGWRFRVPPDVMYRFKEPT